ncbi:glycoside hydrolase family 25 protein [Mucilaginibacter gynuensis]|uniref:Glycoside hydrolase family 25 protein n=1 Tax=Mucilaginibacter gynuensis TaxID=1302236 RepID=A0ABP8H1H7_9SPHI
MTVKKKPAAPPRKKTAVKRKPSPRKKKKTNKINTNLIIALTGIALILLSPFYYGYVLNTFSSAWQWVRDFGKDPHYRTYKSFDINIPTKYTVHGIDVSYAQGKIDWHKVKVMQEDSVHITFAFIKATEGVLLVDPYFKRNWREAAKAGIICGAYHYFRPEKSGKWQARFFMQNVNVEKGDMPMVVDVETLKGASPEQMRKELKAFLESVEAKTGTKPIIYSGLSFYKDYLQSYFEGYRLWIAHYYKPELKAGRNTQWLFWQHSDKARVNGINHTVDFDAFHGDSIAFRNMLITD